MKLPRKDAFCIHFRGIQYQTCRAGVDWRAITGGNEFGIALRMPCSPESGNAAACDQCHYPTPEEQAQKQAEMDAVLRLHFEDAAVINAAHQMDGGVSQVYVCERCDRNQRYTTQSRAELLVHFQMAHKMQAGEWTGAVQNHTRHSDARDWFQDDYRLVADGRALCLYSARIARRGGNGR